jgi:glycosyltransferase involved in cell wall biosynthesis
MTGMKHLLIVARHYWPSSDDLSLYIAALAGRLRNSGCKCTVITPRWHHSWPTKIYVSEVPVLRFEPAPVNKLRQGNYARSLKRFLSSQDLDFDAVLCSHADWEAIEVVQGVSRRSVPVLVLYNPSTAGQAGHVRPAAPVWSVRSSLAIRACSLASIVLVTSQHAHQQLVGFGISADKIIRLPVWMAQPIDYSERARNAARRALSNINYELVADSRSRVLLVPGEFNSTWNIDFLIDSVWHLLEDHPNWRLWIHGDGPTRDRVYKKLKSYGVHRSVVSPGVFSSIETILQAADGCVFPAANCGTLWLLPTCIASGIPVVAPRTQELVSIFGPSAGSLMFAPDSTEELSKVLANQWDCLDSWAKCTRDVSSFVQSNIRPSRQRTVIDSKQVNTLPEAFWNFSRKPSDSTRTAE